MEKVLFELEQDADGYPPVSSETVWATPLEARHFKIENTPFYAKGVSWGDVVEAEPHANRVHRFTGVVRASGHSTIRVIVFDLKDVKKVAGQLESLGCSWEEMKDEGLLAIDIPPEANFGKIVDFLNKGFSADEWDFEEAAIRHRG